VLGLERNQQDVLVGNVTQVRVVKNRWSGETGLACRLEYNRESGRTREIPMLEEPIPTAAEFD